jgi:hypothetical protein
MNLFYYTKKQIIKNVINVYNFKTNEKLELNV